MNDSDKSILILELVEKMKGLNADEIDFETFKGLVTDDSVLTRPF